MEIEENDNIKIEDVHQAESVRTDFSSENFKIEVRGFGRYGYGVSVRMQLEFMYF